MVINFIIIFIIKTNEALQPCSFYESLLSALIYFISLQLYCIHDPFDNTGLYTKSVNNTENSIDENPEQAPRLRIETIWYF